MERFQEMLEHMSNAGIVVVSRTEHTVLYANKTFRNAYPEAVAGTCIGTVMERDDGIKQLIRTLRRHENGEETDRHCRLYLQNFGGMTEARFDEFCWEETPAYVVYFTLVYSNEAEKYQTDLSKIMGDTLSSVYAVVTAVDLTDNVHLVLASDEKTTFREGDHGNFSKALKALEEKVHPDDREVFSKTTELGYLTKKIGEEGEEIHLEFQMRESDESYHWMALRFVRVRTADRRHDIGKQTGHNRFGGTCPHGRKNGQGTGAQTV